MKHESLIRNMPGRKLVKILFVISLLLFLQACGSGGGSDQGAYIAQNKTAIGVFKDSNVSGLSYISGEQKGVTKHNGGFSYEVGSPITFSVGGVNIGTTLGKSVITPADLVYENDAKITKVNNIVRFLIMLDDDANPDNGIHISKEVRSAADKWSPVDFSSADLSSEVELIRTDCIAADGGKHCLPDPTTAEEHLNKTLDCINGEFCLASDLDMALHLLPPLGEASKNKTFDQTLTDFLKVSVCEVTSFDDCIFVEEFTSQSPHKGLDFIKLQEHQYHVNWKVAKGSAGKEFEIHFMIGDLEVRYMTYAPPSGRTVPIKFQIEKNPFITAYVLRLQDFSAESVTQVLMDEFSLGMEEILSILKFASFELSDIVIVLRDFFDLTADDAAVIILKSGWSCLEVGEVLKGVYSLNALETGVILATTEISDRKLCGGADEIFKVFTNIYGLSEFESEQTFQYMGWDQSKYLWITAYSHVKQFAPQLLFDEDQEDFPMDAQKWFEVMLCKQVNPKECFLYNWKEDSPFSNQTIASLRYGFDIISTVKDGKIPTYYRMSSCYLGQLRIEYWWFYGNQPKCDCCSGDHPADWENIMVITNDDRTDIAAILFYQHKGWYIKNGQRWQEIWPNHPDVYVGRNSHGSYYTGGGLGGCTYFADPRDPKWYDVPDGTVWKTWDLSTFINVQGPEYSPDLQDIPNLPKENQQSWIQYTKELGGNFAWAYEPDGEPIIWTNPYMDNFGAEGMCNRLACKGYGEDATEGCIGTHTDCKACPDHQDQGAFCAEDQSGTPTYGNDYWVPTWDRGLYSVYAWPICSLDGYCPCGE